MPIIMEFFSNFRSTIKVKQIPDEIKFIITLYHKLPSDLLRDWETQVCC